MSNSKHTPGPWYALRGQRNISIRHKTGDRLLPMVNVASVRGQFPTDCPYGSSEANARLIAAAPDMLAALQGYVDAFEHHFITNTHGARDFDFTGHIAAQARAAIAKATGDTK